MKALSLREPWASWVVDGRKSIEIRTWKTNYRGELFIHASKTIDKRVTKRKDFDLGYIIGKVDLVDCFKYTKEQFVVDLPKHLNKIEWYNVRLYGFKLSNPKRIKPIPYKGKLNIFEVVLK